MIEIISRRLSDWPSYAHVVGQIAVDRGRDTHSRLRKITGVGFVLVNTLVKCEHRAVYAATWIAKRRE
jgi:hypothetical protein